MKPILKMSVADHELVLQNIYISYAILRNARQLGSVG